MEFEEPRAAACEVELLAHAHQTPSTAFVVGHFRPGAQGPRTERSAYQALLARDRRRQAISGGSGFTSERLCDDYAAG
jgi:hypothetical protein